MKKIYKQLLNLFLVAAILIGGITAGSMISSASGAKAGDAEMKSTEAEKMEVHFIDVGQGDAALVICDGHAMLIDAGDYSKGTAIQNYLQKQKVKKLDYLILTHPDSDHIGGAPVIITKFEIDKVFVSNYEKDNKTYQKLIQALDNKHLKYTTPEVGAQYSLGTAEITILAPNGTYDDPNDASIAMMLQNGENRFLFTGDAEENAERDILATGIDLSADVYKAGHHGSRTSTSQDFFEAVSPSSAVISCGEDNSYGHPHAETLNTFRMNGVKVYRTDEDGTLIATSDGKRITFNVPASETWKSGEPGANSSVWEVPDQKQETGKSETQSAKKQEVPAVKESQQETGKADTDEITYILNTKTNKFHKLSCSALPTANRKDSSESRESIIAQGYEPCKRCNP
ncbi:MAG: MBL fold metallo-hydrolase [Lachnospiraceae bacterium]|nr:MBL fold metallo-hydrolase [Lachnospiraceae bacterium]